MAKYAICSRLVISIQSEIEAKDEAEAKEKVEAQFEGQVSLAPGTLPDRSRDRVNIKALAVEHTSVVASEDKGVTWKVVGGPYKNPPWTEAGKRERGQ